MGACFNYIERAGSKEKVAEEFDQIQREDRYENGHSYSGGFGMATGISFLSKPSDMNSGRDAEEWLAENAQKWGPALAVPIDVLDSGETHWGIGAWCSE